MLVKVRLLDLYYIPLKLTLGSVAQGFLQDCPLTTKVLPAWKEILADLGFMISLPRDVATRWNLTFDVLEYALKHCKAVNLLMQWHELGLRKFELSDNKWVIIEQLHSVLKVSDMMIQCVWSNTHK